jgi:hypothetical protein
MADLSGIAGDIYQFRIWLRGISPMIWRRMLVPATTHLAAFHTIIQQAFGWDDCHLHRFHIHGCDYGIWYPGTPGFRDDPTHIRLQDFRFRQHERFLMSMISVIGGSTRFAWGRSFLPVLRPAIRSVPVAPVPRHPKTVAAPGPFWRFSSSSHRITSRSIWLTS